MGKIDLGRVILGGLLAGLVFNVIEGIAGPLIYGADFAAGVEALGRTMPDSTGAMAYYIALGFVFGIAIVWIYAAIRPRFGPGPRTAVYAGLIAWFMTGIFNTLGEGPIGLFSTGLYVKWMAVWLINLPLSAVAGAWLYKEGDGGAAPVM